MSAYIRRGLWLLPLAGVLIALPWFEFIHVAPGHEHMGLDEAQRAVWLGDQVAIWAYVAGFLCLLFGLLALHAWVTSRRADMVALPAVVLTVLAVTFLLSVELGVVAVARPVAAQAYLAGHEDVGQVVLQLSGGAFAPRILSFLLVTILVAALGAVATAATMWRSGSVPKAASLLLPVGFLLTMTDFPVIAWVGSALLLVVGSWIAWLANRAPAPFAERAPAGLAEG